MPDTSARLALPYLAPGQAQKELFHNEALTRIDAALHAAAQTMGDNTPPATRVPGQCWIVGDAPVGDWAGRSAMLAAWTEGGWRFVAPTAGMTVWLASDNLPARWEAGGWRKGEIRAARVIVGGVQVVGARRPAIADPAGGETVDAAARSALAQVISALRGHGLIE